MVPSRIQNDNSLLIGFLLTVQSVCVAQEGGDASRVASGLLYNVSQETFLYPLTWKKEMTKKKNLKRKTF